MAVLEYQITGNVSGLNTAANSAKGILAGLQQTANGLKLDLLGATTKQQIDAIGGALTIVTGKIKEYANSAIQGSQAFKEQQAQTALESLSTKIKVLTGNAQLFGQTLTNQQAQVKAYSDAINILLKNGYDPLDAKVQGLKGNIDRLTASIEAQKQAAKSTVNPFAKFAETGALLTDAENKVRNLENALKNATSERSIAQYNVRLREAQGEFTRLNNIANQNNGIIAQAEKKVFDLSAALRSATTKTGISQIGADLQKAQTELSILNRLAGRTSTSFNTVGVEFGRVIQDLPYAANNFGAIGNNITRVVEILPGYIAQTRATIIANGGVATSANVAKTAIAGLFTGFGAISLAISALVSGFVIYQQVQQSAARSAKKAADVQAEQKKALDDYIQSLDEASRVSARAVTEYSNESTKLDILYKSLIANSNARYENVTALEELQKSWPEEFASLEKGVGFTDKLTASYKRLKESIFQTGVAAAAQSLAADSTKKLVENTVALQGAIKNTKEAQEALNVALDKYNNARFSPNRGGAAGGGAGSSELNQLSQAYGSAEKAFEAAKDQEATFRIEAFKARQEVNRFQQAAVEAQNKISTPVKSGLLYDLERELKRLQDLRPTIKIRSELDSNTKQIADIQKKIDDLNAKKGKGSGSGENLFNSLNSQLDDILRKTQSISAQAGLSGYALDVQKVKDKYIELNATLDENIRKTQDSKKLTGSERATLEAKQGADRVALQLAQQKELDDAFNDSVFKALEKTKEKADKSVQIEQEARDKISAINEQAIANIGSKQETETQKIQLEWDKRKKAAQEYYDQLFKLNNASISKNDPLGFDNAIKSIKLQIGQATTNGLNDRAAASQIENNLIEPFKRGIDQGLRKFATDFYQTLTDVDTYAKGTFGSIFADLTSQLTTSLNQVFLNVLVQGLADSLKKAIASGLSSLIKDGKITGVGIAAGAALGGAVVSSATPKTSTLGQAAGGALSGAGTGFLIGGPVGAVVGGVVGAISGIFGAASARKKQEELQKQQLEEAKKQTEYLRQQQVAYQAQIIGRMTTNGVVTGINVGSQGQLVATVSGKDLQFVLDRNKNGR